MATLQLKQFVRDRAAACHFARPVLEMLRPEEAHDHNFVEVFWIEGGRGWHCLNGTRKELAAGSMVFMRAKDRHAFSAMSRREALKMVNIAFRESVWRALQRRYGLTDVFDAKRDGPLELKLSAGQLASAQALTSELAVGRVDRVATDRFLLNLVHLIEADAEMMGKGAARGGAPAWLRKILIDLANPMHAEFPVTTEELAMRAGCSPEHVARTFRRCLGRTPTEVLNDAKLARAAARLAGGSENILGIALACGFGNLSHFYKLFRERYSTTPRQYRVAQQRIVWARG